MYLSTYSVFLFLYAFLLHNVVNFMTRRGSRRANRIGSKISENRPMQAKKFCFY